MDEAGARLRLSSDKVPLDILQTEQELKQVAQERREAISALIYEKAAAMRLKELALKARLAEQQKEWQLAAKQNPAQVEAKHIEQVITTITGIPTERISHGEAERLRGLKNYLTERVVGQQQAVERITKSLIRSRSGLKDANRPIGVFLFIGPTGVGKTLLAKELSKWLFDHRQGLIRIDMSEYSEKHNVARLIGSPPGYVGYGEGGQLSEAVRRRPYAVVLFDEIEKAHPDIFNTMLQIFDEGHLTDGSGRKVDFKNTVIILTSNIGSRSVAERSIRVGFNTSSKQSNAQLTPQNEYSKALENTFAPEFLNRIDDVIYFRTLSLEDVEQIITLELESILSRAKKIGLNVEITPTARKLLATMGYESRYGVRALRRTLLDKVEEPLSELIIEQELSEGCNVVIDEHDEQILLRVA
jgi:ATP-dependent Clp protease ATP-binding subunit ClpC